MPADDGDRFLHELARSTVAEVKSNHLTNDVRPQAATTIGDFLAN